jgi:hypothetical protein
MQGDHVGRGRIRPVRALLAALAGVALVGALTACGNDQPTSTAGTTSSSSSPSTTGMASGTSSPTTKGTADRASTITTTLVNGKPHFGSPEDAMRYLADAWNRNDLTDLKHVTDPSARDALNDMHQVAVNLRLDHCELNQDRGDYTCYFDHDYPPHASTTMAMDDPVTGHAVFTVGPAATPGWYMTVLESCS